MTRPRRRPLGIVTARGFTAFGAISAVVTLRIGGGLPGKPFDTILAAPDSGAQVAPPLPSPEPGAAVPIWLMPRP